MRVAVLVLAKWLADGSTALVLCSAAAAYGEGSRQLTRHLASHLATRVYQW
jgi:hypothetical protein